MGEGSDCIRGGSGRGTLGCGDGDLKEGGVSRGGGSPDGWRDDCGELIAVGCGVEVGGGCCNDGVSDGDGMRRADVGGNNVG